MLLPTINKLRGLLLMGFIGDVSPLEIHQELENLPRLLRDLPMGFILIIDLERVGVMTKECAREIGKLMELFDRKGVRQVIRVIPDKSKDIGFQVLYHLHYKKPPPLVICENMVAAGKILDALEREKKK